MKKLIVLVAMAVSLASSASMIDWKYSGVAADKNASVYLYVGATAPDATTFADVDALQSNANVINTGKTITETTNPRFGTKDYTATGSGTYNWADGDKYYFILVSSDDKSLFVDPTATTVTAAKIYEAGNTGPGAIATTTGSSTHSYAAFAPEPTSGILMLVGLGALALRRRKA